MIEVMPVENETYEPDLVEVVRCKNCAKGIYKENMVLCTNSSIQIQIKAPEDYCSDGRRRVKE